MLKCLVLAFPFMTPMLSIEASARPSSKEEKACSTRDYSKQMGPVRNQENYNVQFCSSYTAADMVGQRMGLGSRISAMQTAVAAYEAIAEGEKYALMRTPQAKEIITQAYGTTKISDATGHAQAQIEKPLLKQYAGLMTGSALFAFNLNTEICVDLYEAENVKEARDNIMRLEDNIIRKLRPNQECNRESREKLLRDVQNTVSPELFHRLLKLEMEKECSANGKKMTIQRKIVPKIVNCKESDKSACRKNIDVALNKGRIAGISYFPARIHNKVTNKHAYHASSIVARKWDKSRKTCQYLIRNSWGKDCTHYKKEPGIRCLDGNIWVDTQILSEMMNQSSYIK